jgi:hypothetical protein
MPRMTFALVVIAIAMTRSTSVAASPSAPALDAPVPASVPGPAPAPPVAPPLVGLAVVAIPGASDAAWPLARAVYADPSLRAPGIDEAHARVLCGVPAASTDSSELRDLSDTISALRGDDAPSRSLLDGIARRLSTRGLVVVRVDSGRPTARVFLADSASFDAATYGPDDSPVVAWSATTRSLLRLFGPAGGAGASAPDLATHDGPRKPLEEKAPSHPFYESTWFWGAIAAAALVGGVAYLATRDSRPATIHLEVEVPH